MMPSECALVMLLNGIIEVKKVSDWVNWYSDNQYQTNNNQHFSFVEGQPLSIRGKSPPGKRYDVDQVPLPLVLGIYKTWGEEVKATVCVYQTGYGIKKRFCTIQLIFRMDEKSQALQ